MAASSGWATNPPTPAAGLTRFTSAWATTPRRKPASPAPPPHWSGRGQTVLIDGGTSTFYLARELVGRSVQLVTNSLPIGNLFLNDDSVELLLTGGLVYPRYGVLLGPHVESFLASIHASTLFLSCAGVHEGKIYNQNLLLVQAERQMMRQVQQVVLLVDSTKFGQQALAEVCDLTMVHTVVTDAGVTPEHAEAIRKAGCELIVAASGA